ncbi:MAG: cupredoxin domain-containing protein [Actinomycetota bacterium]
MGVPIRVASLAAAGLMLAGCGGSGGKAVGAAPSSDEKPGEKITVVGKDNRFEPATLSRPAGTRVTVVLDNEGALPHTFTINGLGADTGIVNAGDTKSVTFTVPSEPAEFVCTIHLEMKGSLSPA